MVFSVYFVYKGGRCSEELLTVSFPQAKPIMRWQRLLFAKYSFHSMTKCNAIRCSLKSLRLRIILLCDIRWKKSYSGHSNSMEKISVIVLNAHVLNEYCVGNKFVYIKKNWLFTHQIPHLRPFGIVHHPAIFPTHRRSRLSNLDEITFGSRTDFLLLWPSHAIVISQSSLAMMGRIDWSFHYVAMMKMVIFVKYLQEEKMKR